MLNTPGVTNDATFGLLTFRGVAGNNSFLLDGNDNTEQFYDENAGRTRIQSQISADAVQEFQVVSANFSAEYGRAMGGVVNTVTKSGTNDIHGSAFYFLRSTGFDAHDPYSAFNPTEHRIQTGGTVGGAIIKNKLFYFLSTDITRRNFPFVDSQVKVGFVDTAQPGLVGCAAPATPAQCNAINGLLPRFFGQIPRTATNDLYFGRLDYHLNDSQHLQRQLQFPALEIAQWHPDRSFLHHRRGNHRQRRRQRVRAQRQGHLDLGVPTSLVNSFRYGLDTDRQADGFDQAELGGGLGYLDVAVAGVQLGPATYLPRVEPLEVRNEFADDVSWAKGKHTDQVRDHLRACQRRRQLPQQPVRILHLSDRDFVRARLHRQHHRRQELLGIQPDIRQSAGGLRDQRHRILSAGSVEGYRPPDGDLGARYEHTFAPPPPTANPLVPADRRAAAHRHRGSDAAHRLRLPAQRQDRDPRRRGHVLRAPGRRHCWTTSTPATGSIRSRTLDVLNATLIAPGPSFPNALAAPLTGITQGASTLDVLSPKLKTPYSEQATIAVERQIAKDMVLTVSGIFSRGVNLYGTQDINAPALGAPFTYTIAGAPAGIRHLHHAGLHSTARPNSEFRRHLRGNQRRQQLVRRAGRQLSTSGSRTDSSRSASYTWSHEIDDGQGAATNAIFGFSDALWTYNGQYGFDKGSGSLDQRQRFVYTFVWAPDVHAFHQRLRQVRREQLAAFEHHDHSERTSHRQPDDPPERHSGHACCTAPTLSTGSTEISACRSCR